MYDIESEEYFVSRNVKFMENVFPFADISEMSENQIDAWGWSPDSSDANDDGNEPQTVVRGDDLSASNMPLGTDIGEIGGLEEAHTMQQ